MTYLISEDTERALITVTLSGSVDDEELLALMDEVYRLKSYQLADQFIDFSSVEHYAVMPGGLHDCTNVAKVRPERAIARDDRRIVLYAPDDVTFGMSRLLTSVADAAGIKLWVYRNLEEALAKIGLAHNPAKSNKNGTSSR
jgi:hypothetical protein